MYYKNPNVKNLHRVFDQNDRTKYLRLDLNENPGGLPMEIVSRVLNGLAPEVLAQYPETNQFSQALASSLGTDSIHICLVNGSAEGIRYIIEGFTSEQGKIVGVVPSYMMFQIFAEMYGRRFCPVAYHSNLSIDVEDIIAALTDDTELLILLNPNNPMGNVYSDDEFEQLIAAAREKQVTVLVDEAYYYFYPKSFIRYALEEEHIFITRSFSKLFSMAGCRLGYVVGWPEGITIVQKLCTPHNANTLAMKLAEEVIKTPGVIEKLVSDFEEGRSYLIARLDEFGYHHKGEAGNFLFIQPKTDAQIIVERMKEEKGILIKKYPSVGELGDCLRVTIGGKKYMEKFINALRELDH